MSNPERQHGKEPRRRSLQGLCLSQSRSRPQQFRFETAIPLPGRKNKSIPRRPSSPKWSIFGRQKQKTTTRNSSLKISATETNKKKTSRKSTNYNRGNGIRVVAQRTLFLPFCRRCCSCCFLLYNIFFWVPYKGRAADAKIQSDSATLRGGNSIGEEEKEAKAKEKEKRGALICMRLEGDLHTAPRPRTSYSVDRATWCPAHCQSSEGDRYNKKKHQKKKIQTKRSIKRSFLFMSTRATDPGRISTSPRLPLWIIDSPVSIVDSIITL